MASAVASIAQVDTPTVGTLTIAVVAGTLQTAIPENEYLAFTIAKANGKGGFKATQQPYIHFANVDTGA